MLKQIKTDIYHLLHPKMAFLLTSISKKGKPNVMTCAWATPVSEKNQTVSKGQSIIRLRRTRRGGESFILDPVIL